MKLDWFFAWWNAVYALPLAFVLVLLTVTSIVSLVSGAFGSLTHGDSDADVGAHGELHGGPVHSHDSDADVDADVDHDLDVDAGHDLDADGDVDVVDHAIAAAHGHAHPSSPLVAALAFLGVGRAPVMILLQLCLLLWGVIGLSLHQAFRVAGPLALLWSVPLTAILSVLGTRAFALLFGRYLRSDETAALRSEQLIGCTGQVVYPVTAEEGTIHVRDEYGTLHRVRARCPQRRLEAGQRVVVLGYDPAHRIYEVDDPACLLERH